ncbi:MAG: alpha-2-macroglobulin family protein [Parabacteroides sp.]|nr:alpha-2-macroglobulin family protein [Parabacteroides sp.]
MKIKSILLTAVLLCGIPAAFIYTKADLALISNVTVNKSESSSQGKVIKAHIKQIKDKLEKDQELFPSLISETEKLADKQTDPASKAILHSMIAELYGEYYGNNRYRIDRRTAVEGFIPEDIREWTSNHFAGKIKEHIKASLTPADVLQQTPSISFKEILETGEDSPELRPALFDLLAHRGISILGNFGDSEDLYGTKQLAEQLFGELNDFRKSDPNPKASLLVALDYLQYSNQGNDDQESRQTYAASLDSLMHRYKTNDFSTEIRIAQINLLESEMYQSGNGDSIRTIIHHICTEGVAAFPSYSRIAVLKNRLAYMEQPSLEISGNKTFYPGSVNKLDLKVKNLNRITLSLYRSIIRPETVYLSSGNLKETKEKRGVMVRQQVYSLSQPNTYQIQDTSFTLPALEPGLYECEVASPGMSETVTHLFVISRLAVIARTLPSNEHQLLVTDLQSGKPLKGITVRFFENKNREIKAIASAISDKDGLVTVPIKDENFMYQAVSRGDSCSFLSNIYTYRPFQTIQNEQSEISLFTDRSLYRPGQTVFFKGIAFVRNSEIPKVIPGETYTVILRDANYKEVASRKVTTNTFGSFSGEFTLPSSVLNGSFSIETHEGSVMFDVAEYKRPTFSLSMLPLTEAVAFGDNISIKGEAKTYSGTVLKEGTIQYRIIRKPQWLRGYYPSAREKQVANGKTDVSKDGTFTIGFVPTAEKADAANSTTVYRYEVIALATDSKGESQESRYEFMVGHSAITLNAEVDGAINKEQARILITAKNLNGLPASVNGGTYIIARLKEKMLSETVIEPNKPEVSEQVMHESFVAGDSIGRAKLRLLPSGRYRITLKGSDAKGRSVSEQTEFILFGKGDKKPPVASHTWLVEEKTVCLPGEEAVFTFGTSHKNAYVLYEITSEKGVLSRKWLTLSDENKTFRLPYSSEFGKGVSISFAFVKEGTFYNKEFTLKKKEPEKTLNIKPVTFRDKLVPGSEETWSFKIADTDSLPVLAEVLAGMYDASLDKIKNHSWWFNPSPYFNITPLSWRTGQAFSTGQDNDAREVKVIVEKEWIFDRLDWQGALNTNFDTQLFSMANEGIRTKPTLVTAARQDNIKVVGAGVLQKEEASSKDTEEISTPQPEKKESQPQLRQNFAETAFFYPDLQTNKAGEWIVKFRLPESNTTWKMMALAHTKDLKFGQWSNEVVSQKELMVIPNLPRFMRKGDNVSVATQIINLSEKEISGKVRLELVDPATDEVIVCMTKAVKAFTLPAGESVQFSWNFPVPERNDLIICRIVAETPDASDGEQHLLPVLPNQIPVTESVPFYLSGDGEKTVSFPAGSSKGSLSPYSMTLEVTANPIWYAVQALPVLSAPSSDNLISWFASYVSNTVASSLANSNPRIQPIIAQWKAQGETTETLHSKLQQNESLKQLLLKETPWVLEAENEAEQKQRLSLLFDSNRIQQLRQQAITKLLELQTDEGGWSWFKGMPETPQLTVYILKGMAQLSNLKTIEFTEEERGMINKALTYMDSEIVRMNEKKELLHSTLLEYLYVRTQFKDYVQENEKTTEAIRHYISLAGKEWSKQSLYNKGCIALIMQHNGKETTAQSILAWLRKTATQSEEMGMYWANNKQSGFFISPIDTHCLLMEVFGRLSQNTKETDQMKQWLLNQKRTQMWESVPSTVNAIHALIATGSNWLSNDNKCTATWGSKVIDTTAGETGTGYVKEVIQGTSITPAMQTVHIRTTGNAPAWGAIYRQYFEDVDKITGSKGALQVEKKLFVEKNNGKTRELQVVTDGQPLHRGDKVIVRLTVRADRDMEFVHLKDLRAGCFEPAEQLAGTTFKDGLWMYHSPEDAAEQFFIHRLPKGTFVMEYSLYVDRTGSYSGGISTIQCLYAPEFISNTAGSKILIED